MWSLAFRQVHPAVKDRQPAEQPPRSLQSRFFGFGSIEGS
jgi:hypothetical protein